MGAEIFRHDQQSRARKITVWKRSSLFDAPRFRCFCLGLGNERRSSMHIVTSWCEGVRNGPCWAGLSFSFSHTHTRAHAHTRAGHKEPTTTTPSL